MKQLHTESIGYTGDATSDHMSSFTDSPKVPRRTGYQYGQSVQSERRNPCKEGFAQVTRHQAEGQGFESRCTQKIFDS